MKSSLSLSGKYSTTIIGKELFNIEYWPLWNKSIKEAKLLKSYSNNLSSYTYLCEFNPGIIYQFNEKRVIFKENDEIYIYGSQLNKGGKQTANAKYGNVIIDVTKIYMEENEIIINSARQTNLEVLNYDAIYLKAKNSSELVALL